MGGPALVSTSTVQGHGGPRWTAVVLNPALFVAVLVALFGSFVFEAFFRRREGASVAH